MPSREELMAHQVKRSAAAKKKMGTPNKSKTKHTYSKPKAKPKKISYLTNY